MDKFDVVLLLTLTAIVVIVSYALLQDDKSDDEEIADIKTKMNELVDNINNYNANEHKNIVKLCSLHPDCEMTP